MTEQPVETEQQFLGNEPTRQTVINIDFTGDPVKVADAVTHAKANARLQSYAPGAHLRRPSWSPGDDAELSALVRACRNAAKLVAITKEEAVKAETALQTALAVEDEAAAKLDEAERALLTYTRKDAGL